MKKLFVKFSALLILCLLTTALKCQGPVPGVIYSISFYNTSSDTINVVRINGLNQDYKYDNELTLTNKQFVLSGNSFDLGEDINLNCQEGLKLLFIDIKGDKIIDTTITNPTGREATVSHRITILPNRTIKLLTDISGR